MNLRPYQNNAIAGILGELASHRSTLAVMPTGTGKTVVFASLIKHFPGRVMILAHRTELVEQAAAKVLAVTGENPDIEMGQKWAKADGLLGTSKVIVSSIQTQNSGRRGAGRMNRFNPDDFDLVVIDEAHHAPATSWREVIGHYQKNPRCKVVGFTATPDRKDEQALGQVFDSVGCRYELRDAIEDGYLVPIHQKSVYVKSLDFSSVRTTAGDLNGADLAEVMEFEENIHGIVTPTFELSEGRQTLVFAASRIQAERMTEIFNRHVPNCAAFVDCMTPPDRRKQIFDDFHAGRIRFLVNVGIATEGWDGPSVEVVAMARPTKSRSLYAQMVGRGTRPHAGVVDFDGDAAARRAAIVASPKPFMEIIDFVGNAGRHQLVSTADILGGFSEEAKRRVKEKHASGDDDEITSCVIDQLKQSEAEIQREQDEEKAREQRRMIVAKAKYSTSSSNPFNVFDITPTVSTSSGNIILRPTAKQLGTLAKFGIDGSQMTMAEAGQMCQECIRRMKSGKCTFKQAKLLKRFGYSSDIGIAEASRLIDAIAANCWRKPESEAC